MIKDFSRNILNGAATNVTTAAHMNIKGDDNSAPCSSWVMAVVRVYGIVFKLLPDNHKLNFNHDFFLLSLPTKIPPRTKQP